MLVLPNHHHIVPQGPVGYAALTQVIQLAYSFVLRRMMKTKIPHPSHTFMRRRAEDTSDSVRKTRPGHIHSRRRGHAGRLFNRGCRRWPDTRNLREKHIFFSSLFHAAVIHPITRSRGGGQILCSNRQTTHAEKSRTEIPLHPRESRLCGLNK